MRLELTVVLEHLPEHLYFNSIKVRLELRNSLKVSSDVRFQFHKGAIRTELFKAMEKEGKEISIP